MGARIAGKCDLETDETVFERFGSIIGSFITFGVHVEEGFTFCIVKYNANNDRGIFAYALGHKLHLRTVNTDFGFVRAVNLLDRVVEPMPADRFDQINRPDGNKDDYPPQNHASLPLGHQPQNQRQKNQCQEKERHVSGFKSGLSSRQLLSVKTVGGRLLNPSRIRAGAGFFGHDDLSFFGV